MQHGPQSTVSSAVVIIPAGAKVGAWYEHVLGGPQIPNDPDNPIAKSHKGPLKVYLAKVCSEVVVVRREVLTKTQVDSAGTADWAGVDWFKVAEEGLDTTTENGEWIHCSLGMAGGILRCLLVSQQGSIS